jgi:hypothetical protein
MTKIREPGEEPRSKPKTRSEPPDPAFTSWLVEPLRTSRPPPVRDSAAPTASSEGDSASTSAQSDALLRGDLAALGAAAAPSAATDAERDGEAPVHDAADSGEAPVHDAADSGEAPVHDAADSGEAPVHDAADSGELPDEAPAGADAALGAKADAGDAQEPTEASASPDAPDAPDNPEPSLTPQILAPFDGDRPSAEELASIGLGPADDARLARRRRLALAIALLVLLLAVGVRLLRSEPGVPPELAVTPPPEPGVVQLAPAEPGSPNAEPSAESEEPTDSKRRTRAGRSTAAEPEPAEPPAAPTRRSGPSVGRLPDLPREQLQRLAHEAEQRGAPSPPPAAE